MLDRPGGRTLLGYIATRFIRSMARSDVEVLYAYGLWTHRVSSHYFPDGPKFDYVYIDFRAWIDQAQQYISQANDFWLQHYMPRAGDTIIDVGAGHGEDTFVFSRAVGETGRVIAIEAHPGSFEILSNFCRLNQLRNVTLLQTALMDKPGLVRMEQGPSWLENTVEYEDWGSGPQVPASTLDEICHLHKVDDIHFVKMNIEGAERYALRGMQSMLSKIRQICVACHDFRADLGHGEQYRTRRFVEEFLAAHGFALSFRSGDPRAYVRDYVFGLRCDKQLETDRSLD
jgi:FkbM family methyltransferase